jgi:hypothetical protein
MAIVRKALRKFGIAMLMILFTGTAFAARRDPLQDVTKSICQVLNAKQKATTFDFHSPASFRFSSALASVSHGQYEEYSFSTLRWKKEVFVSRKLETNERLAADSHALGFVGDGELAPFLGPTFIVASPLQNARFTIRVRVQGIDYEAPFTIRKSPTFVGLRAVDFKQVGRSERSLRTWPNHVESIGFIPVRPIDRELTVFGNVAIKINPTVEDLKRRNGSRMSLIESLLRDSQERRENSLSGAEIRTFVKVYERFIGGENLEFATRLGQSGNSALRAFLRSYGFDTQPLSRSGQLSMLDYLSEFHRKETPEYLTIPSEPGLFGAAHGEFSHALQIAALLKGTFPSELAAVKKVLWAMTSSDHPELWMAWGAFFNGFRNDGPQATSWWPHPHVYPLKK